MYLPKPNKIFARRTRINESPNWRVNQQTRHQGGSNAELGNKKRRRIRYRSRDEVLEVLNRKREEILFNDPDHEPGVFWDEDLEDQEDENIEDLNDPDPNQLLVETDDIEGSGVEVKEEEEEEEKKKEEEG